MAPRDPILIDLPEVILGEKVLLRPWKPGDGAELFATVEECRDYLREYMPWADNHTSTNDSEAYARRTYTKWILREDLAVAMFSVETGELLGASGLHRINWNVPSFEIGYWLAEKHQGHGYVTEAVWLLLQLAFNTLEAQRVVLQCNPKNLKSEAVARRIGFRYEGLQQNWGRMPDGGLFDTHLFALNSVEWLKLVAERGK